MDRLIEFFINNPSWPHTIIAFLVGLSIPVFVIFLFKGWIYIDSIKIGPITIKIPKIRIATETNFTYDRKIYSDVEDVDFITFFKSLVNNAGKIVLIGTGLEIVFQHIKFFEREIQGNRHQWEIYMANPFDPAIEMRLTEEETGSSKPPVGKYGLISRIETILDWQKAVEHMNKFEFKLFSHYPTFSIFIIDDTHYFFYSYGFSQLGNFSPIGYYSAENPSDEPMIAFIKGQYILIKEKSTADARLIHDLHIRKDFTIIEMDHYQKKLLPFAVYVVPDEKSELYELGSELLGYDVRRNKEYSNPDWSEYVKTTRYYGFHLTVADVLYYTHNFDRQLISKEINKILSNTDAFDLDFKLKTSFPDNNSISLVCSDSSGSLELIHTELVRLCYRKAIASNYSPVWGANRASPNRNYATRQARNDLMTRVYHAPFILQEFKPHFSLVSGVPPATPRSGLAKWIQC